MKRPLVGALTAALLGAAALTGVSAGPATATSHDAAGTDSTQQAGSTQQKAAPDFAGTVALSNCSGSVVRVPQSQPTDPALVLSNGHCLESGMPDPGTVVVDEPSSRSFTLLDAGANEVGTLNATKIAYGTMTDTDASIYELSTTYEEIESEYGIKPLDIAPEHPKEGTNVTVVSGYWKDTYSCAIDGFAHQLKEGGWTQKDSIRYTPECQVIGGTSGSPLVDDATGQVVGVNNTTNENGEECTLNNPCEVDENGNVTVHEGIGYAQQVYLFADCITTGNKIDLSLPECELPSP
ncbi:serine protease [Streptomyces armeniacus]|uniref:Serine protease n=1 Tax=Streptomyces armeniacus TaxID=83291 RepID=A0A345XY16_9ACTN|nr:serine protease [Streptomyces armeniacus]AXK36532.1 serine protease [Streptomyces armeniacus]